jgi:hypothetical protein
MAITQLKDGRWIVFYRKGTIPEDPGRTREYFGHGIAGKQAMEQRNKELGFGRRKPQVKKKNEPAFGDIAAEYQEAQFARNTSSTKSGRYYKLKSVILPELGHLPVDRLTRRRLDQHVNNRLATQLTAWTGPETNRVKKKLFRDVKLFFIPSSPLSDGG